jgi:hypothetical protein
LRGEKVRHLREIFCFILSRIPLLRKKGEGKVASGEVKGPTLSHKTRQEWGARQCVYLQGVEFLDNGGRVA